MAREILENQNRSRVSSWQISDSIPLRYQIITPVATCHWQWIANVFAADGYGDYWERLGLSWGCRWLGDQILFGLLDWPQVLRTAFDAEVEVHTYSSSADAMAAENDLSVRGLPFIAEVDQFYLKNRSMGESHTVHAILVLSLEGGAVRYVDSHVSAQVITTDLDNYRRLRASECWGRVEPYKLYVALKGPSLDPSSSRLLDHVLVHAARTSRQSLRTLADYIDAMYESAGPIDVCRAAGERYQGALLFGYLAAEGLTGMAAIHQRMTELTDDWYLVHMLSMHERAAEPRARQRQMRLLELILEREMNLMKELLA